jgi:hypothetical protein
MVAVGKSHSNFASGFPEILLTRLLSFEKNLEYEEWHNHTSHRR